MELLADALYQETVHLLAALVHQMAHAGVLLGHQAQGDTRAVHFSLRQDPELIRQVLGLTPAELLSASGGVIPGTRQWTALVPEARLAAFEAQLQDLSHAEFLDRQRTAGEFRLGELWLRASPGVYHPAPGSSTRFMPGSCLTRCVASQISSSRMDSQVGRGFWIWGVEPARWRCG
jgi:hypothetical protein